MQMFLGELSMYLVFVFYKWYNYNNNNNNRYVQLNGDDDNDDDENDPLVLPNPMKRRYLKILNYQFQQFVI